MKKMYLPVFTISLLALTACNAEQQPADKPTPVRPVLSTVAADVESVLLSTYPGRAKARRELNVGFEVPGKLISRPVEVGSMVKTGDVLATLDPAPYLARVRTLEGQRDALLASLEDANKDLKRTRELLKKKYTSQARVDDLVTLVRSTEANIEATNGALDEARLNLKYTTLVAPFDGTVSETFVENFQVTNARLPIVRLLDTSKIEMEVAVPENLINLEPYVQSIDVQFSSLPDLVIPAQIAHVGNDASPTTRTYPVTIVMDQPPGNKIQPGMAGRATAKVKLPADLQQVGIQIPVTAIFSPNTSHPDDKHVWIIDENSHQVSARQIQIRSFTERGVLVSGVNKGERIVTAGANSLIEGQKVRLHEPVE
ncbi:efflux RND transporter periplasmic adaptor subunit [Photobacterium sp. OFAV2-7]|uniref:efflux RND transporter periplasmic adaptor subunit n=1 Tax=Photobacterium sp. OFAV2-7 TaxID=2917748 RepID=UPI001EF42AE6|nr:efflux RND transporter periplasmic adaptor subunit [Photobacterium sp. OFAV2-7]MCG7587034.1 efflux RND transporter periplasmic adaptor subunit [Photobacterium sp. OFAV2-7]